MPSASALRAALVVLVCGVGAAQAAAPDILLVDASRARRPVLAYGVDAARLEPGVALRFARLSPPLVEGGTSCCVRIAGRQRPSRDVLADVAGKPAVAVYSAASLTDRREAPFIGVAFSNGTPEPIREDAHTLLLPGRSGEADRRLVHCLSSETLHVRVIHARTQVEQVRYALPLNMDVEADCDERWMPTLQQR
ncbi:hypothetical protein PGB34_00235 [Xenophilus arseniciresistens]|uniref:Uncharacterized protein n=1 Tax=Xenophilus arseniciresistens TaxID=1283306 RepID=A0AAE3N5J4_9BURK|nr:hypothetical protein [Xenophilus arseniciresistens]MDA7414776.1 hypothetical protein [Xenophilus arseniciresistens]